MEVGRAYTAMKKDLEQEVDAIHPTDYVRRFCNRLGMSNADMKVEFRKFQALTSEHVLGRTWQRVSPQGRVCQQTWNAATDETHSAERLLPWRGRVTGSRRRLSQLSSSVHAPEFITCSHLADVNHAKAPESLIRFCLSSRNEY